MVNQMRLKMFRLLRSLGLLMRTTKSKGRKVRVMPINLTTTSVDQFAVACSLMTTCWNWPHWKSLFMHLVGLDLFHRTSSPCPRRLSWPCSRRLQSCQPRGPSTCHGCCPSSRHFPHGIGQAHPQTRQCHYRSPSPRPSWIRLTYAGQVFQFALFCSCTGRCAAGTLSRAHFSRHSFGRAWNPSHLLHLVASQNRGPPI